MARPSLRRPGAGRAHDPGVRHAPAPRLHMGTTVERSRADQRRTRTHAQRRPPRTLRPIPGLNLLSEPGYLTSTTQSLDQGPPAVIALGSRYGRGEGTSLMRV